MIPHKDATAAGRVASTSARRSAGTRANRARTASPASIGRVPAVDVLRGAAIVLMVVYHLCFDLNQTWVGILHQDFTRDPFWLSFRALIVTFFLALVGVSLVLAVRHNAPERAFWTRVGLIAACAALVSVGSYAMFPQSFIYFGILHFIAVACVLARPFVPHPRAALVVGAAIVAIGCSAGFSAFDSRALNWIGLAASKPLTEDYVPLFPWLGVVLLGIAAGAALAARGFAPLKPIARHAPPALAWMGRHSLVIYMAHQPILIGLLWLVFHAW